MTPPAADHLTAAALAALAAGRDLLAAERSLPRAAFHRHLAALPLLPADAGRLIAAAGAIPAPVAARIPGAILWRLVVGGLPPETVGVVALLAGDGHGIDPAQLRRAEQVARFDPAVRGGGEAAQAARPARRAADPAAVWGAVEELVRGGGKLDVLSVGDGDEATFTVAHYPAGGGKPRREVRPGLAYAVLALAGREPQKTCGRCKTKKGLGLFARHTRDGHVSNCLGCDRAGKAAAAGRGRGGKKVRRP